MSRGLITITAAIAAGWIAGMFGDDLWYAWPVALLLFIIAAIGYPSPVLLEIWRDAAVKSETRLADAEAHIIALLHVIARLEGHRDVGLARARHLGEEKP